MQRTITSDDIKQALKNNDNLNIIDTVCNNYRHLLPEDTLEWCALHGIWKCLEKHETKWGRKFTTSLYHHVDWQCKGQLQIKCREESTMPFEEDVSDNSLPVLDYLILHESIDMLSFQQRKVIIGKFFHGKSCAEMGRDQGYSREYIRQILSKALSNLRELHID